VIRWLFFFVGLMACLSLVGPAQAAEKEPVYSVTFSDYRDGSLEEWLAAKGFQFEQDAKRRDRIDLEFDDKKLILITRRKALGLLPNESVNLSDFSAIEIDWGVNKHPEGASYEQGVRNEAIMVIVFMGDERLPSGSLFIPDSPYFIGLFICSGDDRIGHPYVGKYFKKSGRYVCVDKPRSGALATSRFSLISGYREFFDKEKDDDPGISGIAVAVDTKKAGDGGAASAFIREIRFYK